MKLLIDVYLSQTSHGDDRLDVSPQLVTLCWIEFDEVVRVKEYALVELEKELLCKHDNEFLKALNKARNLLIGA